MPARMLGVSTFKVVRTPEAQQMFGRLVTWWRSLFHRATLTASKPCQRCGGAANVFEYRASPGGPGVERHFCEACARRNLWVPKPAGQGTVEPPASAASAEVPVEVERVIFSDSDMQLLVLREVGGPRRLPFVLGYVEATTVWWALKREPWPRPFTHQAWVDTVAALEAKLRSAVVIARRGDTYFAELRVIRDGTPVAIDVRPSDALLVALHAGVPFSFAESLWAADSVSEPEPAEQDTEPDRDRKADPGR